MQAYPGVTPFEGLAAGVAALVRHLPAGSPAIFYCIHGLVEKANDLCSRALKEDATMWKSWEGNSESCKKVLDLLLRLIALVDIQVLFCAMNTVRCFRSLFFYVNFSSFY